MAGSRARSGRLSCSYAEPRRRRMQSGRVRTACLRVMEAALGERQCSCQCLIGAVCEPTDARKGVPYLGKYSTDRSATTLPLREDVLKHREYGARIGSDDDGRSRQEDACDVDPQFGGRFTEHEGSWSEHCRYRERASVSAHESRGVRSRALLREREGRKPVRKYIEGECRGSSAARSITCRRNSLCTLTSRC